MGQKIIARFFTIRRSKSGGLMCFTHGKQAGSVYREGEQFWAACADKPCSSDVFSNFAEAELWLWQNYA